MRLSALCAALLLFLSGCVTEEEGCFYDEDCGEGWTCDPATGACLPIEEGDAYPTDTDQSLPDTVEVDTVDADTVDTDIADADTVDVDTADVDTVDADTADADTADVDTADADTADADTADADTADVDTVDVDTVDADTVEVDAVPDADAACNSCACEDCSGHGVCTDQYGYVDCICDTGYAGSWCQQCDYAYQDHDGDGLCEPDDCARATAPGTGWLDCGDHGVCDDWGGAMPADCDCDFYWTDMNGECDHCISDNPADCN